MGGQKHYNASGGFSQYLYTHNEGDTIRDGNLEAKVVYKKNTKDYHESLPLYSNTSSMYFGLKKNPNTGDSNIDQLRLYKDRKAFMDFDWGHEHNVFDQNGKVIKTYPLGTVHVQFFNIVDGKPRRDLSRVRMMSNAEIKKYGDLLRKADPTVKFR